MRGILNDRVRLDSGFRGLFTDAEHGAVRDYYRERPALSPTPLHRLHGFARATGLGEVSVKDESGRFGLNAFKILGVSYAVQRLGASAVAPGLVCATTGNHGRAVARAARDHGVECTVFVPAGSPARDALETATREARIGAMRTDGAVVVLVDGSYEDAVRLAAAHGAETGRTIVSDTSWPGYEQIPRWIMAGYTQLFEEASHQWDRRPDAIVVQGGVGGLVCAAASWAAWRYGGDRPVVIACEPDSAACLLESAAAGGLVMSRGDLSTIMSGLRCAEASPAAWPAIDAGVHAFVTVPDSLVVAALDRLRNPGGSDPSIHAGPSGACGVAAVVALITAPELEEVRDACRLNRESRILAVVTEGL